MIYNKEKFIEAVLFFAKKTKPEVYGMLKTVKLLYFSDLEHLKKYNRTIIGDQYSRIPHGPIPTTSYALLSDLSPSASEKHAVDKDLQSAIKIVPVSTSKGNLFQIVPKRNFNLDIFSDSEIEILERVAEVWKDSTADQIEKGSYEWTKKNLGFDLTKLGIGESIPIMNIFSSEEERKFVETINEEVDIFEKSLTA